MSNKIYMDYAATTYTRPEVLDEMIPYFTESFGNPSSFYTLANANRKAINIARERVAKAISADANEVYFTSGGSEADNWAIKGAAFAKRDKGNHIITSSIEHHAIINTCKFLEKNGFEVTYLPVDEFGFVKPEDVKAAITDKTILVSIMFANNEIGVIEPIKEIGAICREKKVLFHTDAVQAVGHVPVDVKEMNIDLLSMAAHKFHGPKGVGVLYIRRGVRIENLIHGGGQERSKRGSTENVAGIVGMGKAIELAILEMNEEGKRLSILRDKLIKELTERIPYVKLNGPTGEKRLPSNVNMSFIGIEGETLLLDLDDKGVYASTGSACASGDLEASHVLLAIGLDHGVAHGSLRLSLGAKTTEEEVNYVINELPNIIQRRREMSPYWEEFLKEKGEI
ncbi:cysteine desulfurase NifS [Clostridium bovifaecis]|uniref:Cysteine desulfurase IscS n=1 Tax=Clostridium bovifaecis TaxID=2184719 RepID=A0A6I6FBX9_9CLOT|nr:cysteine desulfurase NifS [Clostridium bovifaecis]